MSDPLFKHLHPIPEAPVASSSVHLVRSVHFFVVLAALLISASAMAQTSPTQEEIRDWVQQLGDDSFPKRQEAARRLQKAGTPAIPELRMGSQSRDPEIRFRSRMLLETMYSLEQQQLLSAFLADPDSEAGNRLAGWTRFRSQIGESPADCELLAAMHRKEWRLLRTWQQSQTEQLIHEMTQRCIEIQNDSRISGKREVHTASLAALLFIATDEQVKLPETTTNLLNSLLHYNNVKSEISKSGKGNSTSPLRRIISEWIRHPGTMNSDYQKLLMAMRYNMPTGLRPAQTLLNSSTVAMQQQYALLALGKLGGEKFLPTIREQFGNRTLLSQSTKSGQVVYRCEVRDVALAVAAHVAGKPTASLGFSKLRVNSSYLFSPNSAGFPSEKARSKAFSIWQQWYPNEESAP